jgi:hypothetical protein
MKRTQSYSSLSLYKKCPKAWADRYVNKNRGPQSPAASRGDILHAKLEQFFLGKSAYPSGDKVLAPWQRFMENLTIYQPSPEAQFAVDEEWHPCTYDSPTARMRGKADLTYVDGDRRHILDWKSGRVYPDHESQGLSYVALDPVEMVYYTTTFVYLDIPVHVVPRNYENIHKRVEIGKLNTLIDTVSNDTVYEATPSYESCKYCHLSWRVGGECKRAV